MTTSSISETDSNPQNTEWIDKTVSDTFDELVDAISAKRKLHKSEQHNRDASLSEQPTSMKIYDIINSYHSFCKLCEQHFYSRSFASDINSFFQKHINTPYHRQMRTADLLPDDDPMFTWEEKFLTGRCNVCKLSGLNSYVMDTDFNPMYLMKLHICIWDKENRETNEKVLRKLNLLKKYCGLKIFQEKFIKTMNEGTVCLLCGQKLPWTEENAGCHLSSDAHYQKFCLFLRKCFNFTPKDVLNGFNLEVVTRALITRDPPPITNFLEYDDENKCVEDSNDNDNPYPEERSNYSFSPKHVEKILRSDETDFIHNKECLLCNVPAKPGHANSELHQEMAKNLDQNSFESPAKYKIYCRNRTKRLRIIDSLKRLELGQEEEIARVPPPKKAADPVQKTSSQVNYFRTLLQEKLELVKLVFTATSDKEMFCQVCDEHVPANYEGVHLNSSYHKFHVTRWEDLKVNFENPKFMETFQKIRNTILCLLCGAVIHPNNFYSHLKGETHKHKFERYSNLDVRIPISSAFLFQRDFSCVCTICHSPLNKRVSLPSLKVTLKNVMFHWPCPKLKGRKEAEVTRETNQRVSENTSQSSVPEKAENGGEGAKEKDTKRRRVDFKKVVKTVEGIVDAFQDKIMENVIEKVVIGQLDSLRLAASTEEERSTVGEEPSCGCDDPSECSCAASPPSVSEEKEAEEKSKKGRRSEPGVQKTETNKGNHEDGGEPVRRDAEGENNSEEEHEVLLIEGLPKSRRRYELIYSKFNSFGKIRYVFFDGKQVILAFTEPGVAQEAAKGSDGFISSHKVTLAVSTRRARLKTVEDKLPRLTNDLIHLLEDPQKLMDFVLNLIMQAVTTSESPLERKREELVCSTIISAIYESFPQGRCYPFGSRLSGLTLNNSDLDVFLDCGGMYEGFKNTTPSKERRLVNKVAGLLRKKQEITDIIVVDRARVPIVSFLHKPTLMHCDLSFKNGLSIQNTLLIKFMTSLDWRVRPLILFLKHWAKLNGLHGPPNFSSYAIAMLVIYYLEQLECPVLPTIETLQNNCVGRRTTIGGWDCSINMNTSILQKTENKVPFPQLLAGLFKFYSGFDYNSNVISPLTGKILPRKAFSGSGIADLPMCYKRHVLNIPPPIENLVSNKIPICIIDPFDVSHVLTKSLTSRSLQIFTHLCQTSEQHLEKGMMSINPQP